MADLATLQTRLTEAETALHKIQTGGMVEEVVSPAGDRVRFSAASTAKLEAYIAQLKADIATAQGTVGRRPIYFEF